MKNMCAITAHENRNRKRNQMQMATLDKAEEGEQGQQPRAKSDDDASDGNVNGNGSGNSSKCGAEGSQQQRCIILLAFVLLFMPDLIVALKDVSVTIPQAVKRGSNAQLTCNYDMENDTLYSVKWYKGRREFYRYTPKENPAMKVFAMTSGLNVERNLSNQSHVVLQAVPLNISGKFTCEISVEAPSFQTAMVSGEMEVVELPEDHTTVTGIQARYRIGDLVDGNCSIKYSKPAANLTWTINGIVVPPHHIKTYQIEKHENSSLESVMSAIHFMVTTQHFHKGQMRLKCTASLFDIFKEEIESVIEEDRPRIMASGRSYDMNNYPFDQHSSGDGFEDHNESYLTYYSQNAGSSASHAPQIFWQSWLRQLHVYATRFKHSSRQITALLQHSWYKLIDDNGKAYTNNNNNMSEDVREAEEVVESNSVDLKLLYISCNQFDVWQLSIYAAVAAIWLSTTHQIINCQYKGLCTPDGSKEPSSLLSTASATTSPSSTSMAADNKRVHLTETTMATLSSIKTRKSFSNCQIATISMQKCCCYFVECQQQLGIGVQQFCCHTEHQSQSQQLQQHQHRRGCCRRHGNQNYGNASSNENGNDAMAATTATAAAEQKCQQQMSTKYEHVAATHYGDKMAPTAQTSAWDQRLLMTSSSMTMTMNLIMTTMLMSLMTLALPLSMPLISC